MDPGAPQIPGDERADTLAKKGVHGASMQELATSQSPATKHHRLEYKAPARPSISRRTIYNIPQRSMSILQPRLSESTIPAPDSHSSGDALDRCPCGEEYASQHTLHDCHRFVAAHNELPPPPPTTGPERQLQWCTHAPDNLLPSSHRPRIH